MGPDSAGSEVTRSWPGLTLASPLTVFRLFVYPASPETITYNLAATLALFEPVLTQGTDNSNLGISNSFRFQESERVSRT